ncbi:helix-turn-helix domain-containing protein [Chitinophagaceae bacterium MMS25-I14]
MKTAEKVHHGRNVKRFREMMGLKQEGLAYELGDDWNQKKISLLEAKEEIDDATLELVGKALKVPADVLRNFTEEATYQILSNTFEAGSNAVNNATYHECTFSFNPLEKLMEAIEANRTLVDENKQLYERLLKAEQEKVEILKRMMNQ